MLRRTVSATQAPPVMNPRSSAQLTGSPHNVNATALRVVTAFANQFIIDPPPVSLWWAERSFVQLQIEAGGEKYYHGVD